VLSFSAISGPLQPLCRHVCVVDISRIEYWTIRLTWLQQ